MQSTYHLSAMTPTHTDRSISELLSAVGRHQRFADRAMIQHQGDAVNGFWLIKSGKVMACRFAASGDLTVYAVLGPGDLFGELACFADVPRQVDAVADGEAELVWIDSIRIDRLLDSEPQFARWMLRSLATQLRLALDRIENDQTLSAEARLALAVIDMVRHEGPVLTIAQQGLADLVSLSRVTTGQILRSWSASGLIRLQYRRLAVLNIEGLVSKAS